MTANTQNTQNTQVATMFILVSEYQVLENYNLDGGAPYWKAKGGKEVLASPIMNLEQVMLLSTDEKQAMVDAAEPKSDNWFNYMLIDWNLVTLDSDLVERVRTHVEGEHDLGYARHTFDGTDYEFNWAMRQDKTMLAGFDTNEPMYQWDLKQIEKAA